MSTMFDWSQGRTMKIIRSVGIASCILLVWLTGCSSNANTPADVFQITVGTEPTVPQLGDGKLIVIIADKIGQHVNDVKVDISFGMSSMTMNTQDGPAVGQGNGRFTFAVTFHQIGQYIVRVWLHRNGVGLKTQDFPLTIK